MKLTPYTIFLALLLLLGCGSSSQVDANGATDAPDLDFSDPGEEVLKRELLSLPFKKQAWMYKFSRDKIVRATMGVEHIYLETANHTVICVDRHQGFTTWRYHVETDRPLDWVPAESAGVPGEIRELEAKLLENKSNIEKAIRKEGRPNKKSEEFQDERKRIREQLRVAQLSDNVYLVSKGMLICIDRRSGTHRWSYRLRFIPGGAPFAVRNYCFIPGIDRSRVWQLRAREDDRGERSREIAFYRSSISSRGDNHITARPIYSDPNLFFVSHDGKVYAYEVKSQKERWTYGTDGPLRADPVIYRFSDVLEKPDGKTRKQDYRLLFLGGTDGTFYAIDADGGVLHWRYETGAPIYDKAHVSGKTVYVKTRNGALHAFAVNPQHRAKGDKGAHTGPIRSGNLRWKLPLGERFLVKGNVFSYVMGPDHTIYAMDEFTGKISGRYPLKHFPIVLSNEMDGTVYFVHASGYVFAVRELDREN